MMDFEIFFFVLLLVTWSIKLLDKWVLKPRRVMTYGAEHADTYRSKVVDYAIQYFPVILFVFVLRSFVVEPFRIPSGSMLPTLQSGDMIAVKKFAYGVRLPIINQKIIPFGEPKRGDVVVFRYPVDPSSDYIKRIVGMPGDVVRVDGKQLFINNEPVKLIEQGPYVKPDHQAGSPVRFTETLGDVTHDVLLMPKTSRAYSIVNFPYMEQCRYLQDESLLSLGIIPPKSTNVGVECTVPQGHYFVMGDNRDNSQDSRFWGFVPENAILGKAFLVWMNLKELDRIGTKIK